MKKILSILMISLLLLVSVPFASAEVDIRLGEPFTLHFDEQEAVFHDVDMDNGDLLDFEFDLSDIIPERIIWGNDMGNFRLRMIIPAAVAFSWVIMRNGEREENDRGVPIIHLSWFREEGDVVNIDNRYNLNILDVQGGEADSENVVTLRLDRANPIL